MVFVDEVGFQYFARVSYGRSKKGSKAVVVTPGIRSKNISVIAGITNESVLHFEELDGNGNATALWMT